MRTLKATFFAATLSLATAFGMTAGQTIIYPDTAQAGVVSSVKSAAKKVGGGIKTAAKAVGSAAKTAGGAVKTTAKGVGAAAKAGAAFGKQVGVGVAKDVKRVAVAASPVLGPLKSVPAGAKKLVKLIRR
jgi:hypothetical protein